MLKMKDQLSGKPRTQVISPRTMMSNRSLGLSLSQSSKKDIMSRTSFRFGSDQLQMKNVFRRKKRNNRKKTEVDVSKLNWSELYRPVPLHKTIDMKSVASPKQRYRDHPLSPMSAKNARN